MVVVVVVAVVVVVVVVVVVDYLAVVAGYIHRPPNWKSIVYRSVVIRTSFIYIF